MKRTLKPNRQGKLLEFLFSVLTDLSKTRVREILQHRYVSVNGRITTRFDHPVQPNDEIRIETSKTRAVTPDARFNLEIIYEDAAIIIITKPAGLLTIATEKIQRETAIFACNDYLNKKAAGRKLRPDYKKRVFVVHRLDRDVSGLLIFAKTASAKFRLQQQWADFTKEYLAVAEGRLNKNSGVISSYLKETKTLRVISGPKREDSRKAVTHYEVLKPGDTYSLVKIRLETGRKHQIRVHMADLGNPIAGDEIYGAKTNPVGRIALHAWKIAFKHPVSGQNLAFESPLPGELEKLIPEVYNGCDPKEGSIHAK
ncbi:MAG: RluA family pseudouridine synthase [Candidatus Omnitrophica bacterium]|nr:RluA family pseudouridine synthase [Candidatus Omnitrophota bacterium]